MGKRKRKLTAQQRAHKKRRRREFMTIFVGGKQKRVKRPPTIEGLSEDEFIRANADPLWYHQNEMWEEIGTDEISEGGTWAEREEEFIRLKADPIWYQNETCAQIGMDELYEDGTSAEHAAAGDGRGTATELGRVRT